MSSKLGLFLPFIGGPEYAHTMIPLIELLLAIEETEVRNACCRSVNTIFKQLTSVHSMAANHFLELIKNLLAIDIGEAFYVRVASCQIIAELYRLLTDNDKSTLRDLYGKLCVDEAVIIRRSAVVAFTDIASQGNQTAVTGDFWQILKNLLNDESQLIKVTAIECLGNFTLQLKKYNADGMLTEEILPLITEYCTNVSWRIRLAACTNITKIISCYKSDTALDLFRNLYIKLLLDSESEVRMLAVSDIIRLFDTLSAEVILVELMPTMERLIEDPVVNVRKNIADMCIDVAVKTGPQIVAQYLSDFILKVANDEDPLVKLRILKKINVIASEIPSLCTRLTDVFKATYTSSNWRLRKAMSEGTIHLYKHMGFEYFRDQLMPLLIALLRDGVDEVRSASAVALGEVTVALNNQWTFDTLLPPIRALASDEYLLRVTMLSAVEVILSSPTPIPDKFYSDILALAVGATQDTVSNVRIRAAQVLGSISKHIPVDSARNSVRPVLFEMQKDKDKDVVYFSTESLTKCP